MSDTLTNLYEVAAGPLSLDEAAAEVVRRDRATLEAAGLNPDLAFPLDRARRMVETLRRRGGDVVLVGQIRNPPAGSITADWLNPTEARTP